RSCAQHHLPSRRDKAQPAHVSPNVEIHKQGAPSVLTTPNAKATTSQTNPQPACDPPGKESPQNNQKILTATVVLGNSEGKLAGRGINVRGGHSGWIVAPGAVCPDGLMWRTADGSPSLIEAYRNSAIPTIPKWIVDMIRPLPDKPKKVPKANAEAKEAKR